MGATPKDLNISWSLDEVKIPFGFSHFPYEIAAPPKSWAEATGKVTFYRNHDEVSLWPLSLIPPPPIRLNGLQIVCGLQRLTVVSIGRTFCCP